MYDKWHWPQSKLKDMLFKVFIITCTKKNVSKVDDNIQISLLNFNTYNYCTNK